MKKLLLPLLFIFAFITTRGQNTFQIIYGDTTHNEAKTVVRNSDGSYAFMGTTNTEGTHTLSDLILTKTDSMGATAWSVEYATVVNVDSLKNDYGYDFKQTSDNGYIICGTTFGSPLDPDSADMLLIKTDQTGFVQWANVYGAFGNDQSYSVSIAYDGGYYITGFTNSTNSGYPEAIVVKIDFSGNPVWDRLDSLYQNSRFNDGCTTADSGFIAAGSVTDTSGFTDLYVVKYDSIGTVLWSKTLMLHGNQDANAIASTSDGGSIIAGTNSFNGSTDLTDMLVVKLDTAGSVQWAKTYNHLLEDHATDIIQLSNGHYVLTGYSNATNSANPVRVADFIELDSTGDTVRTGMYGDLTADNFSYSVFPVSNQGYLFGGVSKGFGKPHGAAYLIKADSTGGTLLCGGSMSITSTSVSFIDSLGSEPDTLMLNYTNFTITQSSIVYPATAYCFSTDIANATAFPDVNVYPNPVQQTLNIDFSKDARFETLMVCDVFGRTLVSRKVSSADSRIELETSSLPSGIYQVELSGQKNYVTKKFVKVD